MNESKVLNNFYTVYRNDESKSYNVKYLKNGVLIALKKKYK